MAATSSKYEDVFMTDPRRLEIAAEKRTMRLRNDDLL
jgi:hypothetical protein